MAEVKISETNPGEAPLQRAAVALATNLNFSLSKKDTRAAVIEAVKNSRQIPIDDQEFILRRIAAIPERFNLLQLDAVCHPHKSGFNFTFTV